MALHIKQEGIVEDLNLQTIRNLRKKSNVYLTRLQPSNRKSKRSKKTLKIVVKKSVLNEPNWSWRQKVNPNKKAGRGPHGEIRKKI